MARRKKKTRRKRRVPTNSNTQRVQTTVNINTMSEPKKKKKRRRRKPKTVQPDIFTLARYIPAKRHYFEPNQRFNNMAGKPTIEQRIEGQYNNLEKKWNNCFLGSQKYNSEAVPLIWTRRPQ